MIVGVRSHGPDPGRLQIVSPAPIRRGLSQLLRRLLPEASTTQRRLAAAAIVVVGLGPGVIGLTGVGPVKLKWAMYSNSDHHEVQETDDVPADSSGVTL